MKSCRAMTLLLAALAPAGIAAFGTLGGTASSLLAGTAADNCSLPTVMKAVQSCTDTTNMCTNSCGQFMKAHGDECSKDATMGASVKATKAMVDRYCGADCNPITFAATCTADLNSFESTMQSTHETSAFCNGACFKYISDNKVACTSANQSAGFKQSIAMAIGMCSSAAKGGCQLFNGFFTKCSAMMDKDFKMTTAFCASPCKKFITEQKCSQTGIIGLGIISINASDTTDDSKQSMAAMEAMCNPGTSALKNKAGQNCSPMTIGNQCDDAADDLKDVPCNSTCAKALVPCVDVMGPWMAKNMPSGSKEIAMLAPFAARCEGHLSSGPGS